MNGNFLNALVVDGDKPYRHRIVFGVDGGFKVDISHRGVEGMDDGVFDYAHGLGIGLVLENDGKGSAEHHIVFFGNRWVRHGHDP